MKDFLKKAFPFLSVAAGAFGGPIGLAGAKVLGRVIGKEVKAEEIEAELTALSTTEEGRQKAVEAEKNFVLAMTQLGYSHVEELEKIAGKDRESARGREIAMGNGISLTSIQGLVLVFFAIAMECWIILRGYPERVSPEIVGRVMGTLDAIALAIVYYNYGGSRGSDRKTELIAQSAQSKNG